MCHNSAVLRLPRYGDARRSGRARGADNGREQDNQPTSGDGGDSRRGPTEAPNPTEDGE